MFSGRTLQTSSIPSKQIDLTNLGFRGLPPLRRFTLRGNVTVNSLDREHVLVTFDTRKLMRRVPESTPAYQDRMIRAPVLDLTTSTVTRQAALSMAIRVGEAVASKAEQFV